MAALGGALHDPPAVARCLAAAEALLSGDAVGEWTVPNSLPSSLIYKVQGFERPQQAREWNDFFRNRGYVHDLLLSNRRARPVLRLATYLIG